MRALRAAGLPEVTDTPTVLVAEDGPEVFTSDRPLHVFGLEARSAGAVNTLVRALNAFHAVDVEQRHALLNASEAAGEPL